MDQNPTPPSSSDTPNPPTPQVPVTPPTPEVPPATTPPSAPSVVPPVTEPSPQPIIPSTPPATEPAISTPATPAVAAAPTEHQAPPSSLPPTSHKKTIAVAAAGISVILVVVGVYAMTKENFNTQTKQEAATSSVAQPQQATTTEPTASPTPSDPVEQAIGAADTALMNADEEASLADQGLNATPATLE